MNHQCSTNSSGILLTSFYSLNWPKFLIYALPHDVTFISMALSSPAPSASAAISWSYLLSSSILSLVIMAKLILFISWPVSFFINQREKYIFTVYRRILPWQRLLKKKLYIQSLKGATLKQGSSTFCRHHMLLNKDLVTDRAYLF